MTTDTHDLDVDSLIDQLDGSGSNSEWAAVKELRDKFGNSLPSHLLRRFKTTKKWAARSSMVYHAIRYAREADTAVELAIIAAKDKSKVVRYRACMLLACSQRKDLLPTIQSLVDIVPADTKDDLLAVVDAIESQNQNYFVDRDHSGKISLNIR